MSCSLPRWFVPLACSFVLAATSMAAAGPPVAPVRNVVDEHWGVQVDDPYRYMENLKDPEVQSWFRGQADHTTAVLGRLPGRDDMLARIRELDNGRPYRISQIRRMNDGRLFYLKINAGEIIAKLYTRPSLEGDEKLLLDPSTVPAPDGGHWSIGFYQPSPDGGRVAYGLALSGSEQDILHVLDVKTGAALRDTIDRMEDGYTPPHWLADGSGFFYSRRQSLPAGAPASEVYKRSSARFHRLGTDPESDPVVFALNRWPDVAMTDVDFPSIVLTRGSRWAIGKIKHGDSNPLTLWVATLGAAGELAPRPGAATPWTLVCDVPDSVTDFAVHGDQIYLVTSHHAPRFKVVRTSLVAPSFATAEVVVPPSEVVIDRVSGAEDALYIDSRVGATQRVARVPYNAGPKRETLELPDRYPSGRVTSTDDDVPGALVTTTAWTRAGRLYAYRAGSDKSAGGFVDTRLTPPGKFDALPGFEAIEVQVPSHDGVMVPLSILYKSGIKLDGSNPTLLTGYGSYGNSRSVEFNPIQIAWLERGGVYAVAHVRGGGELGEDWHLAGQKLNKPNTWKDFIACAEWLIAKGYTTPARLAGQGGSAGGILIGRAITERPDLFAAGLIDVGAVDCIRIETTTNGVPNIPEFGTVTKPDEFRGLLEMSSYHHVKDGVKYPAVMLSHGINDPRVEPWESGKMAARLQAATASGKPVLFRVDYHAGHGIGSTRRQAQEGQADKYLFLLWQMGLLKPIP